MLCVLNLHSISTKVLKFAAVIGSAPNRSQEDGGCISTATDTRGVAVASRLPHVLDRIEEEEAKEDGARSDERLSRSRTAVRPVSRHAPSPATRSRPIRFPRRRRRRVPNRPADRMGSTWPLLARDGSGSHRCSCCLSPLCLALR